MWFRIQPLSLRESEIDLRDMTGMLRRMSSRPFLRLLRSELSGRRHTIRKCRSLTPLLTCLFESFTNCFLLAFSADILYKLQQEARQTWKTAEGGRKGVEAGHQHGQSSFCFSTGSVLHFTGNQGQGFPTEISGESAYGRMILPMLHLYVCFSSLVYLWLDH